ncbi:MAG TPA: flagellar basal body L-ring protein FlgH [Patescibacteria group bacterium]|nr:flagellar basal body L-ring protein FlgH [Patescibacteria group bacterium]
MAQDTFKKLRFVFGIAIVIAILTAAIPVNAQFIQNSSRSLFSDVKAYKEGDAITIYIMENVEANNDAATSQSSSTSVGVQGQVDVNGNGGSISGSLGTENNFRGRGATSRNERLRARLSAKIMGVEPNGNMLIEGKRTTKVNGEMQTITVTGLVRPVDVQSDNSVYSYNISDLTLIYEGDGTLTKTQEPGLITKFIRILF